MDKHVFCPRNILLKDEKTTTHHPTSHKRKNRVNHNYTHFIYFIIWNVYESYYGAHFLPGPLIGSRSRFSVFAAPINLPHQNSPPIVDNSYSPQAFIRNNLFNKVLPLLLNGVHRTGSYTLYYYGVKRYYYIYVQIRHTYERFRERVDYGRLWQYQIVCHQTISDYHLLCRTLCVVGCAAWRPQPPCIFTPRGRAHLAYKAK